MKKNAFIRLVFPPPSWAALREGTQAPDFSAQASLAGRAFRYSLSEALEKGPVVVFFYPSAYTEGSDLEANAFAATSEAFRAAGATVIGVSLDSLSRLNDYSADSTSCAGRVAVASDADGRIAKAYDVEVRAPSPGAKDTRGAEIGHGFAERTTFVIARDGAIVAALAGLRPEEHVKQALDAVQRLTVRDW